MQPRIQDMHADLLPLYIEFARRMVDRNILFGLSCVIRTKAEQEAFYAQGREPLEDVNAKRMTAGMSAIADKENVIVTHTKNSRHFPDKTGKSRAFDIVIMRAGRMPTWDIKFDGNQDHVPDYLEAAQIGRDCGLDCGAFWKKFQDYPHMQLPDSIQSTDKKAA